MSESTLRNHDGIPQYIRSNGPADTHLYHASMIRPTNVDNKSMKIFVENPFDEPSNNVKYLHDTSSQHKLSDDISISQTCSLNQQQNPSIVHFNQELSNNFNINVPLSRQGEISSNSTPVTSLIPIPSTLSNNLGVNIHHMNQPSITPTMIGTYQPTTHNNFDNQHHSSTGIYVNKPHTMTGKVNQQIRPMNGTSPVVLRYPTMIQSQHYGHQMMQPRMIPPNNYATQSQVIMTQQSSMMYEPNTIYRTNGQQNHHVSPDNDILTTLLQVNPTSNGNDHPQNNVYNPTPAVKITKPRKRRKADDLNASFEDDAPAKSRKRKKKPAEETEKIVEYSLQQLRDLPMLTPVEPSIDINNNNDLSLSLPFNILNKKSKYQGQFGDCFIENLNDFYRPTRRPPPINLSTSSLERRYRLCSTLLDRPPNLPSPPLLINSSEKLSELIKENKDVRDDESIVSTSTLAAAVDDDDDDINLLKTLSSSCDNDLRSMSPVLKFNETKIMPSNENEIEKTDRLSFEGTDKVSVTLTLTTEAANNVQSVIAAVADLLKIAYPSTFDVQQTLNNNNNCTCSTTLNHSNSNNLLSLSNCSQLSTTNRASSIYKIGRETSVSIQSLIDMQPKYCRNCLQNLPNEILLKKRLNELPINLRELTPNSEPFIYFCHEQCFNTYLTNSNPKIEPIDVPSTIRNSTTKRQDENHNERWKRWDPNLVNKTISLPSNTNDIDQLIKHIKIPLSLNAKQDKRMCIFCYGIGDMTSNGPGRLLNFDVGQWCHLNCALWSHEVYETVSGALMCVEQAYLRSLNIECVICKRKGANLTCFYQRCPNTYHFPCAFNNSCVFYKNKTILCPTHAPKGVINDQILEDKSVHRKVWINRDEIKQIQNYMNEEREDKSYLLRIGSLILHNIGQLLPHQLQPSVFHNRNYIYPVGYSVTRFYWSMRYPNRRCAYQCSIVDIDNKPMFRIRTQENENEQEQEFLEPTAKAVWHKIVDQIDSIRRKHGLVKMFSTFISGEDLYGLTEPHIIRLIESLPGVEMLQNYAFKYGRLQLFDMPLTVNPTGCARSEPKLRTHFRRHALTLTSSHSTRNVLPRTTPGTETTQISYVKQFVLSKSTQYRKLKIEWRQNIYLAKSRIQGLGLFAARDLEKHTMVIEYIGEIIRNEVANHREKLYEQQNRGIYMFRLNDDCVVDATVSGCLARYINHSCEPNSIAEVVQVEKDYKIIIITNRRISKGEELTYDYKFDFEEDSKIPCSCGAVNCRKWMN